MLVAHSENRHDVGMVQLRHRLRFVPEAIEGLGIGDRAEAENLERDNAME